MYIDVVKKYKTLLKINVKIVVNRTVRYDNQVIDFTVNFVLQETWELTVEIADKVKWPADTFKSGKKMTEGIETTLKTQLSSVSDGKYCRFFCIVNSAPAQLLGHDGFQYRICITTSLMLLLKHILCLCVLHSGLVQILRNE